MSEKSLLDDMLADAKSAQDEEIAEQGGSALAEARAKARRQGERKAVKSMATELDARRAAERNDEAGRIEADREFREKAASAPPQMAGLEVGDRFELKGLDAQRDGVWVVARIDGGVSQQRVLWATRADGGPGALPLRDNQLSDLVHSRIFKRL